MSGKDETVKAGAARSPRVAGGAAHLLATWGGVGYARIASGTWGSLAALPLAAVGAAWPLAGLLIAVVIFAVGVPAATKVAAACGDEDPGIVVVDEVVGMILAALAVGLHPLNLGLAFLLFRFFDILKPYPCRRLEDLPGGWGIMMDDVMAGAYALAVMHLVRAAVPAWPT